ncbi:CD48 molecule [Phyllostomus discolor]|uniref:CD48 molecule n=1 Tax=Phyllostomus discolor TaxID=89673 RepID=A0A833YE93_9CHIR|nr:CD48 molecule [Phyllostomus discolor]
MCCKGLKLCLALEFLLLPLCFLETNVQGYSAVSGSNVTLPICDLPNNPSLTLFYNPNKKILEWDSRKPNPNFFKTTFKDRVTLDRENGKLYIYKVQKNDTSTYLLKVVMESRMEKECKIPLEVFARSSGVAWIAAWLVVMIPTILGLLLT